jgi:hypothetical protein
MNLANSGWRKASRSGGNGGACVEAAVINQREQT